jgi:predicted Rossmann fold flavoprotein
MRTFSTIIVGAGAGGLMTAAHLPANSALVIDINAAPGRKIAISGGGKCNITNRYLDTERYLGDADFISNVLRRFDNRDLLRWLRARGLSPVIRKNSQYFCPESSQEMINLLTKASEKQRFLFTTRVNSVSYDDGYFHVLTDRGVFKAEHLVVASGGLSFPKLGATSIGYDIAKRFGHSVVPTAPALVGLTVQKEQFFFKELSGISTEVRIGIGEHLLEGALLFAHKGISGPAVLDASLYWKRGKITVNFLPSFSWHNIERSGKQLSSLLPMPKRAAKALLEHIGLDDVPAYRLDKEKRRILDRLRHYEFAPAGTFGYAKAEVTKGGVCTDELDPQTMMSRKRDGLYFVGEVIDVTGRLGGYNFQWAFSSAVTAAEAIARRAKT